MGGMVLAPQGTLDANSKGSWGPDGLVPGGPGAQRGGLVGALNFNQLGKETGPGRFPGVGQKTNFGPRPQWEIPKLTLGPRISIGRTLGLTLGPLGQGVPNKAFKPPQFPREPIPGGILIRAIPQRKLTGNTQGALGTATGAQIIPIGSGPKLFLILKIRGNPTGEEWDFRSAGPKGGGAIWGNTPQRWGRGASKTPGKATKARFGSQGRFTRAEVVLGPSNGGKGVPPNLGVYGKPGLGRAQGAKKKEES